MAADKSRSVTENTTENDQRRKCIITHSLKKESMYSFQSAVVGHE